MGKVSDQLIQEQDEQRLEAIKFRAKEDAREEAESEQVDNKIDFKQEGGLII